MADSPHLSREGFQCLRSAAYSLQHAQSGHSQDEVPGQTAKCVHQQYTEACSKILVFQKTLEEEGLGFAAMAKSIVQKAMEIMGCCGAAVGLIQENEIQYCAVAGRVVGPTEGCIRLGSSSSVTCVEDKATFVSGTANRDARLPAGVRKRRWLRSLIVVPIFQRKSVSAVLEFYFNTGRTFEKEDINVCELMALLVGQALQMERSAKAREELGAERAETLAKLEKLKPQLKRLAEDTALLASSGLECLGTS